MAASKQRQPQKYVASSSTESIVSDDESETEKWLPWFLSLPGNDYFCAVDMEFMLDRFNLHGLGQDVPNAPKAYDIIVGNSSDVGDESVEQMAKVLYGLIHARFIISPAGLELMVCTHSSCPVLIAWQKKKFQNREYGACPRVFCNKQHLLPVGLSDVLGAAKVKLFCPHCEDIYNPKSHEHNQLDGAFFGSTFPHIFLQHFPELRPKMRNPQKYTPKIFGFRLAGPETREAFEKYRQ